MIKRTVIPCVSSSKAPNLILIPGGPGLSSHSISGFDILSRSFHLHYIDFPGANGQTYARDYSFQEISDSIHDYAMELRGKTLAVGHSYGGLFAVDVGVRANLAGVVCVATPFTNRVMDLAVKNYAELKSDRLQVAETNWEKHPSDETLAGWLSEYGILYFAKSSVDTGRAMLSKDPASSKFFKANQPDTRRLGAELLAKIAPTGIPRILIAGAEDRLLPGSQLEADVSPAGFQFSEVAGAGHFVMFDQSESVARLIEEFFATEKERS